MNILPKKRWHVRTKDNIARVRRDEALAAEEERKKQQRLEKAEREARTEALRKKAKLQYGNSEPVKTEDYIKLSDSKDKHVNLFYELEHNQVVNDKGNKEYEKEKKEEKEKYEKQIGYLRYLGQDTNEILGKVSWYNKPREEQPKQGEEVCKQQKHFEDPLVDIRKYLGNDGVQKTRTEDEKLKSEVKEIIKNESFLKRKKEHSEKRNKHKKVKKSKHKKKKKKHKKRHSSDSEESSEEEEEEERKKQNVNLERLRAERLKREREERKKAEEVFARLNGVKVKKEEVVEESGQKYNSQFNPHLARQNYN